MALSHTFAKKWQLQLPNAQAKKFGVIFDSSFSNMPHSIHRPILLAPLSKYTPESDLFLQPPHGYHSVPFHHYLLPKLFVEVSLTGLPFLLLPCSSFSLLLIQKPEYSHLNRSQTVISLFQTLTSLSSHISHRPFSCLLYTGLIAVSLTR